MERGATLRPPFRRPAMLSAPRDRLRATGSARQAPRDGVRAKSGWPGPAIAGKLRVMPHPAETAVTKRAPARTPFRALAPVLAPALAFAALAGCTPEHRTLFLTFVGETPSLRTPHADPPGMPRLGRPPPAAPEGRFLRVVRLPGSGRPDRSDLSSGGAPAVRPPARAAVADAHIRVRRALAERDDELELLVRSLALHAGDYAAAVEPLKRGLGDPLPADDARTRERMAAARAALDGIDADLARLSALILRIERDRIAARRVAAAAAAGRNGGGKKAGNGGRNGALARAAAATDAAAARLRAGVRGYAGAWLVHVSGQRAALDRLAARIAAATGPDTVETIPVRQTLFE